MIKFDINSIGLLHFIMKLFNMLLFPIMLVKIRNITKYLLECVKILTLSVREKHRASIRNFFMAKLYKVRTTMHNYRLLISNYRICLLGAYPLHAIRAINDEHYA